MVATTCPTQDNLRALVNGSLPEPLANETTEHIGVCTRCQSAIEGVAQQDVSGSGFSFSGIAIEELVGVAAQVAPPRDSAYWKAVENASGEFHRGQGVVADLARTAAESVPVEHASRVAQSSSERPPTSGPPVAALLPFLKPSEDPAYIGRLHHFEISRVIGRGGMGIVLEAFDTHLQRVVAIKVLNPEYAKNDVARQRFCREGRAAAAISHEHVVAMHQVAREDQGEVAFLVMQYIEGDTLEKRLEQNRPFPPAEAARIGMQIAAGLSAAHDRGMVHRDIKPANILIEHGTERVKLTDFGLARATDDVRLTKTGMVTGTPLYMSPEQATGASANERSDLFSLGAVLYELLTGVSPFEAPSIVGVMKRIMDETPPAPSTLNPDVPEALTDLTLALLEKDPDRRPDSARSVAQTLATIVASYGPISPLHVPVLGTDTFAAPVSGNHRLVSRKTLHASWAIGALGVISLLVAMAIWSLAGNGAFTDNDSSAFPVTVLEGNHGAVWAVDFDPTGKKVATAIEDGSVRLWDVAERKVLRSFDAHRGIVWMIQYHPTEPMIATSGNDGLVKIWDANDLKLLQEWDAQSPIRKVAFSPDGSRIVAGDQDGVIHCWDIESGQTLVEVTQPGAIMGVDWSHDGSLIATVGSDKIVRVWDAETLEPRQTMQGHTGPIYNVAFADSGKRMATVGWGKQILIWDTDTGQQVMQLEGSSGDNWSVAFCSEGEHAVVASQDGNCRIWDLTNGELVATLAGHESAVHNLSLDPIGHQIATSGRDGTIRVWDLTNL